MKLLIIILTIILLAITSCDTTNPKPPEEKPQGYQEDIPWPSLADSPWPAYHGDAQSTGRSKYLGPTQGVIANVVPANYMQAGITIGYNSTIYYTASGSLFSADINGNTNWSLKLTSEISSTPIIDSDSTIYVSSGNVKTIYAINADGTIKWEYKAEYNIWNAALGLDLEGNIYFITNSTLSVLSKHGELLWTLNDERILGGFDCTFPFSPDGTTVYLQGRTVSLLAVDVNTHEILWTFGDRIMLTGAVVDDEGNIYIFPSRIKNEENYFYSLSPSGEVRWKYQHYEDDFMFDNVEPAIDKNGNIYFGFHKLYSLDNSGNLRWKDDLEGYQISCSILVDNLGNVFIGTFSETSYELKVFSFDSKGKKNWEVSINNERVLQSSAAISEDGTLYYPTFRSDNFYIIK